MANGGKVDYRQLREFQKKLRTQLSGRQLDLFIESCAKELAARLLAKVIKRTPVGQYPSGSGKVGGTLRRGWTGGKSQAGSAFAGNLKVNHFGDTYVIEVENPVEYASYVEFGHRTRNHSGWVEGKFMLTISEQEIQSAAPKVLENKLKKKLGECFK
jgi:hypothetical protein